MTVSRSNRHGLLWPYEVLDFGVGSSWLRGHPQGPESNSGGWLPATSDVIAQVSRALGSFLSGTLASYGASTVARTSDRGHVAEA